MRAERWRQKSNPVLTLDDAAEWIGAAGLCLFLPRRSQFLTPAPSFVESCAGVASDTPGREEIANARGLMIRLVEGGSVLPLNLFGALSEQPDFLASREAFPYIFSLRGGRNWKTPPAKATPLATRIWALLEDGASLEPTEIQAGLGHEISEAAVLRTLMDLWGGLRVLPHYEENGPTRWDLAQTRFEDALNAANKIAQTTGLSALVSLYLESVLAATPEEIETFLSPLTARSKVREVVNGLAATRQLAIVPVGTQTMYHIAGSLPEFAEPEPVAPAAPVARPTFTRERPSREARDTQRRPAFGGDRAERPRTGTSRERFAASGSDRPRPRPEGGSRPGGSRSGGARSGGSGRGSSERPLRTGTDSRGNYPPRRKQFGANAGCPPRPRAEGDRPAYRKFEEGKPQRNYPRREEGAGGDRKPFTRGPAGQRPYGKPAGPYGAASAEGRSDARSGGGKFPPKKFGTGGGKFPPKKFGAGGGKFSPRKFGGAKFDTGRPRPRKDGENRPTRAEGSEGRPFSPSGSRPGPRFGPGSGPRSGSGSYGASKAREGQKRPFFRDKPARPGGRPESAASDGSGFAKRTGPPQREWKAKAPGFSRSAKPGSDKPRFDKPRFDKPGFGAKKFGAGRAGGSKSGGSSFGGKKFGGPLSRGKSGGSRPGFKSGPRPGGGKPPFRKRKDKGDAGKSSE